MCVWLEESYVFKRKFIICFLVRGLGREKEERSIDVTQKHQLVASHMGPYWGSNPNLGMLQVQALNWRPFTLWDDAQPTEPHQPGLEESSW